MYHTNLLNKVKGASWKSFGLNPGSAQQAGNLNRIIKKNLVGSFMVKGVGIAVNLALIPIGINFLDKERFGVWVIINSLLAWLTFFDLGLGNGMRNKLTAAFQKKRIKEARQLISTGYVSIFIATSVALLGFLIANRFINWSTVFNVSAQLNPELSRVITWSISLFLLQVVLKNIGFIMLSLQLTAINNSLSVLSNILALSIIFSWQVLKIPGSLLMYAICICGTPVVIYFLATAIFFCGRFSFLRPGIFYFNYASLKNIGGLGVKFFVIQVAAMLLFQGNNIFITQYFGPGEVTSYNVSYRYFNVVIMVFSILLTPFWSAFTKAYTQENMEWIKSILQRLRKLWYLSVLAVVAMVVLANYVYQLWIGDQVQVSVEMNIANGLFAIIYAWNSIYLYFLNGTGKIRLQYFLTLIVLALYVPLTMLLLQGYRHPSTIIYTNCLIQLLFSVFCYVQVDKILNKKVHGIWNC
jgi:O-antigen/teichoic acid export membrane protein